MLWRGARFWGALAALLTVVGCFSQKEWIGKFVPETDDRLARDFIEQVRSGELGKAAAMLDPALDGEPARKGLKELQHIFAHGTPVSVEVIGVYANRSFTSSAGTQRSTQLSYQIRFADAWVAGTIVTVGIAPSLRISSARFQPIADSLEQIHAFSFHGKGLLHWIVFILCLAVPVFCLCAFVLCLRTRLKHKWLWIIFVFLPLGQFALNWTTGETSIRPLMVTLLGASAFKSGLYAPWTFTVGLPVGAIVFLLRRKQLTLLPPGAPASQPPQ